MLHAILSLCTTLPGVVSIDPPCPGFVTSVRRTVLVVAARDVALGDINGDGKVDAAVLASNGASIYFNDGNGNFQYSATYGVGTDHLRIALGDMNGDGHLNQVLVGPWEKGLRIDGVKIETMGKGESRQEPYRENGKMKRYILDPDGPEFSVLYFLDPMIGMLIGHRTERPEVLELANPNLQLVVFEHSTPVKGPTFLPEEPHFKMTVDGKEPEEKHLLFAWEPGLFQKLKLSPRWLRAWWVTIPLETKPGTSEHTLQVEAGLASPNLGLFAQINYSTEEGVQMRTDRSVGLLWSRKKKD